MTEEINLQKIARSCISFGEFVEKANVALQNPQKYIKNERALANTMLLIRTHSNESNELSKEV